MLKRSDGRSAITTARRTLPVVESVHAMHEPFRATDEWEACLRRLPGWRLHFHSLRGQDCCFCAGRGHRPPNHVQGLEAA